MGQPEVIVDGIVQRLARHHLLICIRWLLLVGLARNELRGLGQVRNRLVEFSQRDKAMAAMPVEPGISRELHEPSREDVDRFAHVARNGGAPTVPEDRVRAVWRFGQRLARALHGRFDGLLRLGRRLHRIERTAEQ